MDSDVEIRIGFQLERSLEKERTTRMDFEDKSARADEELKLLQKNFQEVQIDKSRLESVVTMYAILKLFLVPPTVSE